MFGDSIAAGHWDTEGGWRGFLGRELHQKTIDSEGENWFEVYDLGIGGDTSKDLLKRIKVEAEARDGEHPVKVVIQIGINDSMYNNKQKRNRVSEKIFRQNLEEIIEEVSEVTSDITFIGLTPVDEEMVAPIPWNEDRSYLNSEIRKYENILSQVCESSEVKFIPLFTEVDTDEWRDNLWDGLHPERKGHKMIYEVIKPQLSL